MDAEDTIGSFSAASGSTAESLAKGARRCSEALRHLAPAAAATTGPLPIRPDGSDSSWTMDLIGIACGAVVEMDSAIGQMRITIRTPLGLDPRDHSTRVSLIIAVNRADRGMIGRHATARDVMTVLRIAERACRTAGDQEKATDLCLAFASGIAALSNGAVATGDVVAMAGPAWRLSHQSALGTHLDQMLDDAAMTLMEGASPPMASVEAWETTIGGMPPRRAMEITLSQFRLTVEEPGAMETLRAAAAIPADLAAAIAAATAADRADGRALR